MGQSNIMGPEKMSQDRDASKEFEQPETQTQLISLQEIEASSREEWLTLAQRLKTEERWGEAIAAYKQALSQEASPDHQNHSGQESSNEEQQTGSSSQSFEQLQAQALTYGQQRQWQACIETCEQALALQPTASLYKLLGDVLQLTGRSSEARRSYREALRLRPDFAEVYGNLGNLYAQERQWPRAIECFQRALRYQPQRVALHCALAGVWEQVGNEIEAVRCWHRVLGLDPASGQTQDYFSLGNRWVRLGDWSMAERYYREAIARDEQLTDAWHNLAEVLAHHQNWLSAREMYEQILQQEPQRVISRLGYARVLTKLEDWQGAMAEYHRLAESAPEQVLAQQRFAQTLKDQGLLEEAIAVYRRALTFAPNGFELRLGFAELLCEQEQWEDALPQAEAAIALNPQIAQAHYYAGRAQVARANWQAAIPYLEQAVTLDSQFFWSRYFWGEALLGLEDWQGAAAVLDAAMPLNPEYPRGYCHLGQAFLELEQYSEAVQAYRQAIAFGSNDVSYSHLGLALLKLEDWDGAIDVLNRGLELTPDDEEFHWLLSQVFVEKQDWQAAIEAVGRAVALKPEGLEFNPQLKQLLCRQGPLHEAVNDWQQAVDLNRDDPQLQLGLGVALLEGEIDLERAEACLRRNLELQPNQPQGYFYLGKCSAGQGRLDEALGFYRRSWELSQSVDCGLALAEVLQQLGRWSEAIQQYRQVLLECGESGEALFGLGQALAASERPMEAVMEWRRAIGLGWNSPELYRCLAEALVSLERWDEAVLEWGRLLELQPGNALVRRQRALALIGLGRWAESAQEWQQYWQVAPGSGQGVVLDFRPELGMYGEIPHRQELSLTGDLTIEFWLCLRKWPQDWTNLVGKFVSDEQNEFCLRLKDGERGQWYYGGGEGCTKPLTWVPQETIRLHQWVHIACVRKRGQSGQLYIDGVLHREQDWGQESGATPTEAPVRLMVSSRLDEFLNGQLSEVRVWNVARTGDEIRQGTSEKLETELGLVAVWSGSEDGIVVDRVADHPGEMKQASANGKPRPQVGVCSGELSQKAVDRADTLAQLYGGFAQVELISSQFPQSEGQVSQPIRETEIPCHRIQAEHEEQFLEQVLALVLAHPYEVVHLSQPRMPNMILGLLYKLLWNARVLVDIDDEELSLVGASETLDLGMLLSSEEQLPPLLDLLGQDWTRIAVGLANCDGFRALDSTSVGEAEESLARLVAEVLAVPDCGLSDEWLGLLQRLPTISILKKGAVSLEEVLEQETVTAILKRSREEIRKFHNKHLGQRCVIIGNGPSLNKMDLSFLKDEICFGTNKIYLGFKRWQFLPTYYVAVNPYVIEQSVNEINKISCPKFIGNRGVFHFGFGNDIIFIKTFPQHNKSFSKRADLGLNEGSTVTYVAIQLAYYMGFSEVILIGVDHYFVTQGTPHKAVVSDGNDLNHFDPHYFAKGLTWQLPDLADSDKSYWVAKKVFEESGRKIIDATVNGKCNVFFKQDYRELFKKSYLKQDSYVTIKSFEDQDCTYQSADLSRHKLTQTTIDKFTKVIMVVNPSHATKEEQNFWKEVAIAANKKGWKLVQVAARKIPKVPLSETIIMPARLMDICMKMRGLEPLGLDEDVRWVDPNFIETMEDWEHRRWEIKYFEPKVYVGLLRLINLVDTTIKSVCPPIVLTTNKIDHPVALFRMAALDAGAYTAVIERSPFDNIWLEPNGIFAESKIWEKYEQEKDLIPSKIIKEGEAIIANLINNPSGFRKNENPKSSPNKLFASLKRPIFFLPMDNVLWTGFTQEKHPQRLIDYPIYSSPQEAIDKIADHVHSLGGVLLIKKHPSCKEIQPKSHKKNVFFTEDDLAVLLSMSDVVVTFLTKVAFPALAMGKPTITLAHNPAAVSGATYHCTVEEKVKDILQQALRHENLFSKLYEFKKFCGWLSNQFYSCTEQPKTANFKGPDQFVQDLIDVTKHRILDPYSLSKIDNIKFLAEGNKAGKYYKENIKNRLPGFCIKQGKLETNLTVAFDINRLLKKEIYHSGISRYTRMLLSFMEQSDDIDLCKVITQKITGNFPVQEFKQFKKMYGNDILLINETNKLADKDSVGYPLTSWDIFHTPIGPLPNPIFTKDAIRIVTVHDCLHIKYPELFPRPGIKPAIQHTLESINPNRDFVICDSEATLRDLLSLLPIHKDRVSVVPLAADSLYFAANEKFALKLLNSIGFEPKKYIIVLCQNDIRKNIPALLEVLSNLSVGGNLLDYKILLVTRSSNLENLKTQLQKANISNSHWQILVDLGDEQLASLYSCAAFFVYVPLYEGFGLPPLEAMATGCPVVVSNCSSLPEVVGNAGVYVDPRDIKSIKLGIEEILSNSSLRSELSVNAKQQAEKFSWEKTHQMNIDFYKYAMDFQRKKAH
ncbi:tetratricopeptide repeat protein [Geitlerinema sp. P-1104]|uniref:tetratricopeptide repeat protein n=1 Tax=Geitlerinema sp. P-1104 TaxID=2546230 RepID=UPI0014777996|nr:tetratricopeptide repeat protein [Geitlerinema sp. P-1104]